MPVEAPTGAQGQVLPRDVFMGLAQVMPLLMPRDPTMAPGGNGPSLGSSQLSHNLVPAGALPGPAMPAGAPSLGSYLNPQRQRPGGY